MYEDPGIDYTLFNTDKTLMRSTADRVLNTPQLFKDSQIPYGIVVKPFGDLPSVSFFLVTIFIFRARKFQPFLLRMIRLSGARTAEHTSIHSCAGSKMDTDGFVPFVEILIKQKAIITQR